MVDVATLAVRADTTDLRRGRAELDGFTNAGARTERQMDRTAVAAVRAGRSFAGASNGIRQTSLQLSQVVQQAQAGGGVLRALAIQLPDIGLAFGTVGIAAGIVSGALLSVVSGFVDAGDEADLFKESLEGVDSLARDLDRTLENLRLSGNELAEVYGLAAERVRQFGLNIAEIQIAQAASRLNELTFSLGEVSGAFRNVLRDTRADVFGSVALREALGVTQDGLIDIAQAFQAIDEAENLDQQQQALSDLLSTLEDNNVEVAKLPDELQRAIREMLTLSNEADRAAESMRSLAAEAASVSVQGGRGSVVPSALDAQIAGLGGVDIPGQESGGGGARRGGGSRRIDPFARDLEQLQRELADERTILDDWYFENLEILEDRRTQEALGAEEQNELLLSLEQKYQDQLRDIQLGANDERLGQQSQFFGALATIAESGGEKMARAAKVFGGIEATINAYRAAAQALADPTVPFWGKAAAYAATLATGLSAVASIRGADTAGGGAQGGATASAAAQPSPSTYYNVNLQGQGGISQDSVRDLLAAINEEIANGGNLAGITVS